MSGRSPISFDRTGRACSPSCSASSITARTPRTPAPDQALIAGETASLAAGFRHLVVRVPERRVTVFVLSNFAGTDIDTRTRIALRIVDRMSR
jgi:hypothetical protein